jgi:hypothetical protein
LNEALLIAVESLPELKSKTDQSLELPCTRLIGASLTVPGAIFNTAMKLSKDENTCNQGLRIGPSNELLQDWMRLEIVSDGRSSLNPFTIPRSCAPTTREEVLH